MQLLKFWCYDGHFIIEMWFSSIQVFQRISPFVFSFSRSSKTMNLCSKCFAGKLLSSHGLYNYDYTWISVSGRLSRSLCSLHQTYRRNSQMRTALQRPSPAQAIANQQSSVTRWAAAVAKPCPPSQPALKSPRQKPRLFLHRTVRRTHKFCLLITEMIFQRSLHLVSDGL